MRKYMIKTNGKVGIFKVGYDHGPAWSKQNCYVAKGVFAGCPKKSKTELNLHVAIPKTD